MTLTEKSTLRWLENLTFDSEVNGFHLILDHDLEQGSSNLGPRPKPLLLSALSGCSGMDVVSILKKMKYSDYRYRIEIEADKADSHPQIYHTIRMTHVLDSEEIKPDKLIHAVELSRDKYCSVMAMLSQAAQITVKIILNGMEIYHA